MEIKVEWERVVQTKPYESLRIRLGVTEVVVLPEESKGQVSASVASTVARVGAEISKAFFDALAKTGDVIVIEQLKGLQEPKNSKPKPPENPSVSDDDFYPR